MRNRRLSTKKSDLLNRIREREIRTNITLRLPNSLIKKVDEVCKKEEISRTQLIEELVSEFLGE